MIGSGGLARLSPNRSEIALLVTAGVGGYMAEINAFSLETLPVREEITATLPESPMAHGVWLALRRAHLMALKRLTGYLRNPTLSPAERELWLRIRQARLIELGAVEEYLALPRTVIPRRKRKQRVTN